MIDLVAKSRALMQESTKKNKAPLWELTKIAIAKGKELAKKYRADERLVLSALYLAHIVFSPVFSGDIQKNHTTLSANAAKKYLVAWKVSKKDQDIILNAIRAHHGAIPTNSLEAEIVKNAECYKFITVRGSLLYLHELGHRGESYEESVKKVLYKMEQKKSYLTLAECKTDAKKSCKEIKKLFS